MRSQTEVLPNGIVLDIPLERPSATFAASLFASLRVHGLIFALIGFYLVGIYYAQSLTDGSFGVKPFQSLWIIALNIIFTTLLGVVIIRFYHIALYVRPEHPIPALFGDVRAFVTEQPRLVNALPVAIAVMLFIECYTNVKSLIPAIVPFSWDETFMQLDRAVHFGVDPWRLLQPLFGYWPVTLLVNVVYNMWFFVILVAWVALAFTDRHSVLRMQYLVAFLLTWAVGGSLLAIVFSSAGPAFYAHLVPGADPFAELMTYLRETDRFVTIWAVQTQDLLWDAYQHDNKALINGISAMPSMHNGTAVLVALLAWHGDRLTRIAGTAFAATILLASVHLGWHYAIDAYAGVLLAFLFWWLSGHLARWYMALPTIREDIEMLDGLAAQRS